MRKEIFAAALLLIILAASAINIIFINKMSNSIISDAEKISSLAENGSWDEAENEAKSALDSWNNWKRYANTVLKHDRTDIVSETFYDLLLAVRLKDETTTALTAEKLSETLSEISSSEMPNPESIF